MGKGWGGAIETIGSMIDGLFGLSPEQRKVKIRNKIDELERKRNELLKLPATVDRATTIGKYDGMLKQLREELGNQ